MVSAHGRTRYAVSRSAFRVALLLYLPLRLFMAMLPGYPGDVQGYRDWSLGSAYYGFAEAYRHTAIDYPPTLLYVLYPIGVAYLHLHPEIAEGKFKRLPWGEYFVRTRDGRLFRSWTKKLRHFPRPDLPASSLPDVRLFEAAVKLPYLVFDLALAGLLYWLVAQGSWGESRAGPDRGRLAALAYLWNPAVLLCSGYWGQADPIHSALVVASLAALASHRLVRAGVFLAVGGLMKPLAAPFVPLLAIAAVARHRLRGLAQSGGGGLAAAVVIFLPFAIAGYGVETLEAVLLDLEAMPATSLNAHNLWWLLGAWKPANQPVLGPLTATQVGLALFVAGYAALLLRSWSWLNDPDIGRSPLAARLCLFGAAVGSGFFFFSTHMHENHLFIALPLLLCVAGRSPALAWLAVAASAVCFANMALHDHDLPQLLPGILAEASEHRDGLSKRMLTWTQLVGSYANSLAAGAVTFAIYRQAWLQGQGDPAR